ncbi:MAG: hypothetical protein HRU43_07505 [Simkaniaceae bacterium]|nr:hypothetical protein [Simkaniaceae bacterium]
MKKYLCASILAATLSLPLFAQDVASSPKTTQSEQESHAKQKLIDEIFTDYQEGRYNNFLKRIDETYQEKNKKWEFNSALEERKKLSEMVVDYKSSKQDAFLKEYHALQEAQNNELIEVCLKNPHYKFSSEVRDMIFYTPDAHEQESLNYVHELSQKFKGDGTTPLENVLINIDTEFWLKDLSLGTSLAQKQIDHTTFQKQHLVLHIEKMQRMKAACEGDLVDVKIKSYIETAAKVLPKVKASSATRRHLMALGRGKVAPQNEVEVSMQKIMATYIEKEEALVQKTFPEK